MSDKSNQVRRFRRELNLLGLVLLTVSAITPASSMFIEMPGAIAAAGTGIGLVLLVSGGIGLIMAFVYSELSSIYPTCGGEYVYVKEILGSLLAYPVVILNLVVMVLIPAVLGLGTGEYFALVLPEIPPTYVAIVVIVISTAFGIFNIRLNAWVTSVFLFIELACILYFTYVGLTHIVEPFSILTKLPFVSMQNGNLTAATLPLIATSAATVIFAFNGYEQAIYLSDNTRVPRSTVPRAILISLAFGLLFEAVPTISLLLSSRSLNHTLASSSPYLDYINLVVGRRAKMFLALAICVAVLNACIVNILMTARFIFSTGRDLVWGEWFRTPLVSIQTSQDTPWGATLGVGTLGVLACWLPIQVLTVVTGTGLVFIYFILCVCIIVGRINNKTTTSTGNLEFRPAINPVFAIVGMLALLGIVVTNWLDPATGRPSVIAALVEAVVGVLLYILRRFVFGQKIQIVIPE